MTDYEKYIIARWAYAIGEDFIGDIEYNELEKKMKAMMPEDEYCKRSWSLDPCPVELLEKYGLQRLRRNIKMGYNAESISAITTMEELRSEFFSLNKKSRLSFKIDGWNMNKNFYNKKYISGNTRGRTGGEKETDILLGIGPDSVPYTGRVTVTGEGSIPNDMWDMFQLKYGNTAQRNSVSTVIANGDKEAMSFLAFNIDVEDGLPFGVDKYELLTKLGFKTPSFIWVSNWQQLLKGIELMSKRSAYYNYLTDGLVLENEDTQRAIRLGAWSEEVYKSYVTGFEEKQGAYGKSMVVNIRDIFIRGNRRSSVNIYNIANIVENNLQIGFPIAFTVRSSANAVIDVGGTRRLQMEWESRYDKYREIIDKESQQ